MKLCVHLKLVCFILWKELYKKIILLIKKKKMDSFKYTLLPKKMLMLCENRELAQIRNEKYTHENNINIEVFERILKLNLYLLSNLHNEDLQKVMVFDDYDFIGEFENLISLKIATIIFNTTQFKDDANLEKIYEQFAQLYKNGKYFDSLSLLLDHQSFLRGFLKNTTNINSTFLKLFGIQTNDQESIDSMYVWMLQTWRDLKSKNQNFITIFKKSFFENVDDIKSFCKNTKCEYDTLEKQLIEHIENKNYQKQIELIFQINTIFPTFITNITCALLNILYILNSDEHNNETLNDITVHLLMCSIQQSIVHSENDNIFIFKAQSKLQINFNNDKNVTMQKLIDKMINVVWDNKDVSNIFHIPIRAKRANEKSMKNKNSESNMNEITEIFRNITTTGGINSTTKSKKRFSLMQYNEVVQSIRDNVKFANENQIKSASNGIDYTKPDLFPRELEETCENIYGKWEKSKSQKNILLNFNLPDDYLWFVPYLKSLDCPRHIRIKHYALSFIKRTILENDRMNEYLQSIVNWLKSNKACNDKIRDSTIKEKKQAIKKYLPSVISYIAVPNFDPEYKLCYNDYNNGQFSFANIFEYVLKPMVEEMF